MDGVDHRPFESRQRVAHGVEGIQVHLLRHVWQTPAPVILHVRDVPRVVKSNVLLFVTKAARIVLASERAVCSVDAEPEAKFR